MKILITTNELLTSCGVSKHLLYFLSEARHSNDVEFTILCGGGDAVDDYKRLCKELIVHPAFKHENRSIANILKAFVFLYKLVVRNKYHIIHSHNHYADNIAKFVSYFVKVKTLQTVHGIIDPIGRLNHYASDYFIAVNEHVYYYLTKQKNKISENVRLIRSGIPLLVKSNKTINQKLKIISAGRLIPQKGFDIFIVAISMLKKETLKKVEFIIAGKGDYESELKKLSDKLNVRINFVGQIRNFLRLLSSTHIFVISSQNEGFPMTIIEAAITKNLIISSNFIGYDSILKDNINSLIFNVNSSEELTSKLEYAIENYPDMNEIIERSYKDTLIECNIDNMIKKTFEFYEEILS